jgi:hypothetical protein
VLALAILPTSMCESIISNHSSHIFWGFRSTGCTAECRPTPLQVATNFLRKYSEYPHPEEVITNEILNVRIIFTAKNAMKHVKYITLNPTFICSYLNSLWLGAHEFWCKPGRRFCPPLPCLRDLFTLFFKVRIHLSLY